MYEQGGQDHSPIQILTLKTYVDDIADQSTLSVTTLRIRYDNRTEYLMKLESRSTMGDVRGVLKQNVEVLKTNHDWELKSPLSGSKTYAHKATLKECGLFPNAKLFLYQKHKD